MDIRKVGIFTATILIVVAMSACIGGEEETGIPPFFPAESPKTGIGSCYDEDRMIEVHGVLIETPDRIVFMDIEKFDTKFFQIIVGERITVYNEYQNIDETQWVGGGAGWVFDSHEASTYLQQQIADLPTGYQYWLSVSISPCHEFSVGDTIGTLYVYGLAGNTLVDGVEIRR